MRLSRQRGPDLQFLWALSFPGQAGLLGNPCKEKHEPQRRALRRFSTAIGRELGSCKVGKGRKMLPLKLLRS